MTLLFFLVALLADPNENLLGAWQSNGDDKNKSETLYFYKDGNLLIHGDAAIRARYETKGDKLTMIVKIADEEIRKEHDYTLKDDFLNISSSKDGKKTYKKTDLKLPSWKPGKWIAVDQDFFKLSAPPDWLLNKEPANPQGHQRVTLQDTKGKSALTLMRIPGRKGQEVDLSNALKGILGNMLEGLQIQETVIQETVGVFQDRLGTLLSVEKKEDDKNLIVQTFGHKLKDGAFLVALFTYFEGGDLELIKIMKSLKVKGGDWSEAEREVNRKKAAAIQAEKNANKPKKDDHGHTHKH